MELLRAASYQRVAWKNGGGITDVVAIADGGRPGWRLSVAKIERDGPFSDFAGYDRTIVSLAGGVELIFASGDVRALATFQPFAFPGEEPVEARLASGEPVSDFNVMTLREACTHRATTIGFGANGVPIDAGDLAGFLYVASGTVDVDGDLVYAGDTVRLAPDERTVARAIDGPAMTILVRISAVRTDPASGR